MKQKQYFLIGLFVISGFLLFILGCILFSSAELFSRNLTFETYLASSVQGLDIGSPVKFRGITIGSVERIGFAGTTYRDHETLRSDTPDLHRCLTYVHIIGHINLKQHAHLSEESLRNMIRHGLRARLELQGITGQLFVNLDFLRPGSIADTRPLEVPWDPEELYIPSVPNTLQSFLSIAENISKELSEVEWTAAVNSLTSLATNINQIVTESDIPALTTSFRTLSENLNRQISTLHTLLEELDGKTIGKNFKDISSDMKAISTEIRVSLPGLTASTQATLKEAERCLTETTALMKTTNATLTDMRENLDPRFIGSELEATLSSLSRTTATLEALLTEIREKPSRLFFDEPLE